MSPDDPRHGTPAGYVAHTKAGISACLDCRRAKAAYERQRGYDTHLGRPRIVPSLGVQRRIRALQRLGWSLRLIALECGWNNPEDLHYALNNDTCNRKTRERVVAAYERLSMTIPPFNSGTARARYRAERLDYPPPLAWDDIDDPNEQPNFGGQDTDIDPVVVMRLLEGQRVKATTAEREAALARWVADGGSESELCRWHGWRPGRYSAGLRMVRGEAS